MNDNYVLARAIALALAASAPMAVTAQAPDSTALEEVIVTATRREESLQNTSISVQAID